MAYDIQAAPIENRYARGWHCVGLAQEFRDGKPHSIKAFGTELVAYLGADDRIHVLNAFCPHMGGNLAHGEVKGNSLVCPFHHWSWGADGKCDSIPYCERIPPKAKTRAWHSCEQNQLLFVWHDPEQQAPSDDVAIPRIDACYSEEWSPWSMVKWDIATNCRELVDNLSDMAHFGPIHGAPVDYFANVFEGHVGTQILVGRSERLSEANALTAHSSYFGPAYHITHMLGGMEAMPIESILLNCHVPTGLDSFELRFGVKVKRIPGLPEDQYQAIVAGYVEASRAAFAEDVAVWASKTRIDNPLLCAKDGPIYQLREWYRQFYVDRAEVDAAARERKVFEIGSRPAAAPPLTHVFG